MGRLDNLKLIKNCHAVLYVITFILFLLATKEILTLNIHYATVTCKSKTERIPSKIHMVSNRNSTSNDEFLKSSWLNTQISHEFNRYSLRAIDRLVVTQLPFLYEFYSSLSKSQKLDVSRYIILYEFGGIYVDENILAIRSHSSIENWGGLVVPLLPQTSKDERKDWKVSNAWIASQPQHPFILFLLQSYIQDWEMEKPFGGQRYLRSCLLDFELQRIPSDPAIHYLDSSYLALYDLEKSSLVPKPCLYEYFNQDDCVATLGGNVIAVSQGPVNQ